MFVKISCLFNLIGHRMNQVQMLLQIFPEAMPEKIKIIFFLKIYFYAEISNAVAGMFKIFVILPCRLSVRSLHSFVRT